MKEEWDLRYSANEYVYGQKPNQWFAEKLGLLKPGSLLLPGEGEGRNAVYAAAAGWEVYAFDQSPAAMKKALDLAAANKVHIRYETGDLGNFLPAHPGFDVLALIFVHMPVAFRQHVHQRLLGFLKPGGYVILEAFTLQQLQNLSGGPRSEALLYDPGQLKSDFNGLDILEYTTQITPLDEGILHQGDAFTVRLFAKKPY